tara:strand:+ start:995 stop:1588 length:594 start_codon:yes stop_codon:yes gene_type:complete
MKTYIDCGCHNAKTSNPLYPLIKNNDRVLYIEANPNLIDDIKRNTRSENYTVVNKAISNFNGTTKFFFDKRGFVSRTKGDKVNRKKGMRSGIATDDNYLSNFFSEESIDTQVNTLLKVLNDNNIDETIDILKIDTEGQDYNILRHFFENNNKYVVKKIITEDYFKTNDYKYTLLKDNGYILKKKTDSDSQWIIKTTQ